MTNRLRSTAPPVLALAVVALILSGCGNAREALGLNKTAPDEFAVVPRAPLSMPPDFGLRPPQPGAPRPQEATVTEQARNVLLQTASRPAGVVSPAAAKGRSEGETALLGRAGAVDVDGSIRRKVDAESSAIARGDRGLVDRLIFWQETPPPGKVVDATKEAKRIRENAALGTPVTRGETPVIERKKKGWLEGLFQ
jgi:Protein of unknown function (DUF3035)